MRWDKTKRPQDHKSESGDAFVLVWRPSVEATVEERRREGRGVRRREDGA